MPLPVAAARQRLALPPRLADAARREAALDDLLLYLRVQRAALTGDAESAEAAAQKLIERYPDSIWAGPARFDVGRVRRRTGPPLAARAWLSTARDALPSGDRRTLLATLSLAEIAFQLDEDAEALALANEVRQQRPGGLVARRARRVAERALQRLGGGDAETRLGEGEQRLLEGDAVGAEREAAAVLRQPAAPVTAEQARWLLARAAHAQGRTGEAAALCLELGAGDGPWAARALSTAARWRWNADEDAAALRLYADVARRFPSSPEAAEALYAIGRIHQEAGQQKEALAAYTELVERYPMARSAQEARWRAAWVRYLAGDYAGAAQAFSVLVAASERSTRIASEYWEARALEAAGEPAAREKLEHVADRHPASYYGALARLRLGDTIPPASTAGLRAEQPAIPESLQGPHAARARTYHELGFSRLARLELDALASTASTEELLEAYTAVDAPGAALRLARGSLLGSNRRYLYPLGYWDVVSEEATRQGLDPLLVSALIRQESLFVPDAVSPADAHGLMQLLPRTARELAAANGEPPPDRATLHRVEPNVALGTALLRRLVDRYGGSTVKALAAYNAGEEAVAKWERRHGARPEDEFVELISYRETRDYVKAVLDHYQVYRQLYAASPAVTSLGNPPNAPFDMITMTSPG